MVYIMIYDPAWDMPRVNWQQQGSFEIPEIPPAYEPDADPLVCLPAINQYWLPYVLGALDQLRNPSSWLVADDSAMSTTLYRVAKLREMIGTRAVCMSLMIRFDGETCQLQQSTDGGLTWNEVDGWSDFAICLPPQTLVEFDSGCTLSQSLDGGMTYDAVPGWLENFGDCVQKYTPIIGLPPNPGDEAPDQFACSIASYLASTVILNAMSAAVTAIQDDLTLLAFGANVLDFIPEFVLVRLGYDAISIIYAAVAEGTLTDYEDAIANPTLWSDVTCAIYGAILGDGYVTPGNFSSIVAAVGSIDYTHPDVISKVVDYLNSLGATGLAQLAQRAGLVSGADCSECSPWCRTYDFTTSSFGFGAVSAGYTHWISGVGWVGDIFDHYMVFEIASGTIGYFIADTIRIEGTMGGPESDIAPFVSDAALSDPFYFGSIPAGPIAETFPCFWQSNGSMRLNLYCENEGVSTVVTRVTLTGRGAPPTYGTVC